MGMTRLTGAAALILALGSPTAEAVTTVNCDNGESLQQVFTSVGHSGIAPVTRRPGLVVQVTGTCYENVEILDAFDGIILDGQGVARIHGPDPGRDTLRLVGVRNFTVKGFLITGGRDGVNLRAAVMVSVTQNVIQAGRDGIQVHRGSFALITDNVLANGRDGIVVHESSAARIGFAASAAANPSPNTIEGNGRHGILVSRASTARIAGNVIVSNVGSGIRVDRVSQADIAANTIDGNGQDGVRLLQNSGGNLGTQTTGHFLDRVNLTALPNTGVGLRGLLGSYAVGGIGTLTGTAGPMTFDATAINQLVP